MGNTVLTNHDLQGGLSGFNFDPIAPLKDVDTSPFSSLFSNLRDALFPKKLPPLELSSQPVAVLDPLDFKRSPASSALSAVLHVGIFALMVWFVMQARKHPVMMATKPQVVPILNYTPPPPVMAPSVKAMSGGGGGGAHEIVPPTRGHLPEIVKQPVAPVQELKIDHPRLAAAPAVALPPQVHFQQNAALPHLGDMQGAKVALVSQGSGSGSGFGIGGGGGIGSGRGAGVGPGIGGGFGGGVMSVGGGVGAPELIHKVDPDFTPEARAASYQGTVSIQLIVDPQGNPQDVRVVRHLGMGLDEKAIEAVRQYKFRPAMFQGHPVPVQIIVNVAFHLY